jgi:CRISPR type IV-associated protein Csf3
MIPLRITAYLQSGVVTDPFLPIDGILYYLAHREAYGEQDVTRSGDQTYPGGQHIELPLKRAHIPYQPWFYAASFAQWSTPHVDGTDHWVKRFDQRHSDLIDFQGRRGKIIVEQNTYKAYRMPMYYRHALSVTWYVVGDPVRIEQLLAHATHLGKKVSQGHGAVLRWDVAPHHADWSVYNDDGKLMRAIPAADGVLFGIRPSYWLPRNQTRCQLPEAV